MSVELMGYLGSALITVSLLSANVYFLRTFNSLGCLIMAGYGLAIEAYPVTLMNGACVLINLAQMLKARRHHRR
ncbi:MULTISPECIES: YgjV family protein [Ferrimonas]|uniref:YgjV family protein n=1 Tax=Ferrimonas TaxID=44011 RepID=UPI000404D15B|nr:MULTISPECIES: YgjV family protein [Ferrimonas]USD38114.1 YgjV family protein [Ferrimonas sp. SCSIO 43195]